MKRLFGIRRYFLVFYRWTNEMPYITGNGNTLFRVEDGGFINRIETKKILQKSIRETTESKNPLIVITNIIELSKADYKNYSYKDKWE